MNETPAEKLERFGVKIDNFGNDDAPISARIAGENEKTLKE